MDRQTIVNNLGTAASHVLRDQPVDLAYLYGSQAVEKAHPFSDIDIAVVLNEEAMRTLTPGQRTDMEIALQVALEDAGIPGPDVRVLNDAPLEVRGRVACKGVMFYSRDEDRRVDFQTRTWDDYFDYQPVLELMSHSFWKRLRKEGLGGRRGQNPKHLHPLGEVHRPPARVGWGA